MAFRWRFKSARGFLSERMNLPFWLTSRWQDDYVAQLLDAHLLNTSDAVTHRQVWAILLVERARRAAAPYLQLFKLAWEISRGLYWRTAKKIHSRSNAAPGSSTGTSATPVAQYTGFHPYAGIGAVPTTIHFGLSGVGGFVGFGTAPSVVVPSGPFEDEGIKAGEVTAYRCWKLGADGLLRSVVYDEYIWLPGAIAEGDPSMRDAGIYAYKSVLLLHNYGSVENGTITGTVDLWGEIYEHKHGYRAQYAAIASIDDSPYYDAAAIRKRYGLKQKRRATRQPKK